MNRNDYLEDEWPEESPPEPEAPAEEEESDRGLYTYDMAPSKEEEDQNAKASPEEADYLNAEDTGFRSIDDHRFFRMIEPPEIKENMNWYEMAGYCIQTYFQTGKRYYYHSFLHYFEPTLNRIAAGFMLRYAMIGHFADLKQEAVLGLLEAEQHYDPAKGTPFLKYGRQYMNRER